MASIYERKDSPYIWINYKDRNGVRRSEKTAFRKDDEDACDQAKVLRTKKTYVEDTQRPFVNISGSAWRDWVPNYMETRWSGITLRRYQNYYYHLMEYFDKAGVTQPSLVEFKHVLGFIKWYQADPDSKDSGLGLCKNSALYAVSFLGRLMDAAIKQEFTDRNPTRKLGIRKDPCKKKAVWKDEEIAFVGDILRGPRHRYGTLHVTFEMGLYQACRVGQCSVPLDNIDFGSRLITYPGDIMKRTRSTRDDFTQVISLPFITMLKEIVDSPAFDR